MVTGWNEWLYTGMNGGSVDDGEIARRMFDALPLDSTKRDARALARSLEPARRPRGRAAVPAHRSSRSRTTQRTSARRGGRGRRGDRPQGPRIALPPGRALAGLLPLKPPLAPA